MGYIIFYFSPISNLQIRIYFAVIYPCAVNNSAPVSYTHLDVYKRQDMSLEEYKAISPVFENDIYEAIDVHTCVDKRNTIGAPGPKAMEQVIAINKKWIEEHEE